MMLNDFFQSQNIESTLSDVQAVLVGLLCAHSPKARETWLHYLSLDGLADPNANVEAIVSEQRQQLAAEDFDFQLLLPDDDTALSDRVEALTAWCQSFVTGLGLAGIDGESSLKGECKEIYDDLMSMTHADASLDESEEEAEAAFAELVEFVRVAAQLFFAQQDPRMIQREEGNNVPWVS
ncbi:MAG: UPF0149 family protein [Gammaproteobacteria bacterium]|nr:UPF0149 family protein [Gammaproteobacteria bacterium]